MDDRRFLELLDIHFDLLLEHYDRRIGVLSAGAFYKRLSDPIFLFTEENDLGGPPVSRGTSNRRRSAGSRSP